MDNVFLFLVLFKTSELIAAEYPCYIDLKKNKSSFTVRSSDWINEKFILVHLRQGSYTCSGVYKKCIRISSSRNYSSRGGKLIENISVKDKALPTPSPVSFSYYPSGELYHVV